MLTPSVFPALPTLPSWSGILRDPRDIRHREDARVRMAIVVTEIDHVGLASLRGLHLILHHCSTEVVAVAFGRPAYPADEDEAVLAIATERSAPLVVEDEDPIARLQAIQARPWDPGSRHGFASPVPTLPPQRLFFA